MTPERPASDERPVSERLTEPLFLLLADGRFPAGGHAQSAGVEAAVRIGDVHDIPTLARYLDGRLATTGVTEAAFAAATTGACRAGREGDELAAALDALDDEYDARVLSPALRRVGRRFGRQLLRAGGALRSSSALDHLAGVPDGAHQPIVLGALVAAIDGTSEHAALLVMHHLAAAVAGAAVRLLGLDPFAVAAVQSAASVAIVDLVEPAGRWAASPPEQLPAAGGSLTEILGEDHARWDARLFVA